MDVLNSRAEGIEELLLAHTRGDKKSLGFSIKQALLKYNLFPRLYGAIKSVLERIKYVMTLLVNGAEIQSRFYIFWARLVSLCTLFVAMLIPYRVVYDSVDRWNGIPVVLCIIEWFCELVFWWDIWFHFRKRERFAWGLAAAFPLDRFIADFVFKKENGILKKWLRLSRCLKVKNLVYYRNKIKRRSVTFELDKVKTLWMLYSLSIFWTSCAYFAVTMRDSFGTQWQAWLPAEGLAGPDPEPDLLLLRLFRGLMFATTAFVKKGRTFAPMKTLDFGFSILISFVGQLIMALMIGEMANVFILFIDNEVRFWKNYITVEHYLARWKVSNALKLRANAFLTSWWSSYAGVDYQTVFAGLPRTRGAGKEDNSGAVAEGVMYSIAQNLRFEGYPRGENVAVEGSVCKAMYFAVRGYLFSKSASNPLLYHAGRFRMGGYFGENGLLGHSVSLMTVTSIRASDLFTLYSEWLLEIIKSHPHFQLVFKLAQDVVRPKKSVNEYLTDAPAAAAAKAENGNGERSRSSRRISAPVIGLRQPSLLKEGGGGAQKPSVDFGSARISTFESHLSKLLRVNNEDEWDSAFRLFVEKTLPNSTLNDLDGKPKYSDEQEQEKGAYLAIDLDSSFTIRARRAQSIVTAGPSNRSIHGADALKSSMRSSASSANSGVDAIHQSGSSASADSSHESVGTLEVEKARLRVATLRLQKVMYAGGDRHELLQEANTVKEEDGEEEEEDAEDKV